MVFKRRRVLEHVRVSMTRVWSWSSCLYITLQLKIWRIALSRGINDSAPNSKDLTVCKECIYSTCSIWCSSQLDTKGCGRWTASLTSLTLFTWHSHTHETVSSAGSLFSLSCPLQPAWEGQRKQNSVNKQSVSATAHHLVIWQSILYTMCVGGTLGGSKWLHGRYACLLLLAQ